MNTDELKVVGAVVSLPIDRIVRNPDQPRKRFRAEKLQELGETLREGQIEPIRVYPLGGGLYVIDDGERRWRAAQMVGITHLNSIIVPRPEEREVLLRALIAGMQRENLTPMEEAAAYHRLRETFGLSPFQIAARTGRSDPHVRSRLAWMEEGIPQEIREMIDEEQFPVSPIAAKALLRLPDKQTRVEMARKLSGKTVRAIVNACDKYGELSAAPVKGKRWQGAGPAMAGVAANGRPQPNGPIPLTTIRTAARVMCQSCEMKRELVEKLPEPAWALLAQAAEKVCTACDLHSHDMAFCHRCPGVALLRSVIQGVKR